MLSSFASRTVSFCHRFSLGITLICIALAGLLGYYVSQNIKINTDINQLMAANLDWRILEKDLEKSFPQNTDRLVIVVDGNSPDIAESAAQELYVALQERPDLFKNVVRPDAIPYFRKNGFLFLGSEKLEETLDDIIKAQPFLGSLAKDPSLRGLFSTMNLSLKGISLGQTEYKDVEPAFKVLSATIESVLTKQDQKMPWQSLMSDHTPSLREIRKFILTQPTLDYAALSPGGKATKEVRKIAQELSLTAKHGVKVRLTGSVALNDQEFASVADGMETAVIFSLLLVMSLLYLALRSLRLILPILITLLVGLISTTAFALFAIGSLNLISVAFAVMFVGIAVDFGIQFGVRFREEHFLEEDFTKALIHAGKNIAPALALAASATTLGFIAFIPTDYRGVSELGIIASAGMIIAFILNLTLLPALLSIFKPPAEKSSVGYVWARPLDELLLTKRKPLLIFVTLLTLGAVFFASQTRFDFDPLNLKDPKTESVSTMFDIMEDPDATPYTIQILADNIHQAETIATKIDTLPEVDHTITLASFIPENQEEKLEMIEDTKALLEPTLFPPQIMPAPSHEEILKSLKDISAKLRGLGEDRIAAAHLADELDMVVHNAHPDLLMRLDRAMISGMESYLGQIRSLLSAEEVSLDSITTDLRQSWITEDGRAKIEVYPKGNARNHETLEKFTKAVRSIAPQASGTAVSIQESGKTVLGAFIKAAILALFAIAVLTGILLKRITDVLRLLFPLILAGILTLATMNLINLPLNFANIIALPLLLSLGVSYAIYFVTSWRNGQDRLLSSSCARAVLFSAGTTLVAFGSLSLSSHPGTQGMGELLTIALLYSLLTTFFVLPLLLGKISCGSKLKG